MSAPINNSTNGTGGFNTPDENAILRQRVAELESQLKDAIADRDGYYKALLATISEPEPFTEEEIEEMKRNPLGIEDILESLQASVSEQPHEYGSPI